MKTNEEITRNVLRKRDEYNLKMHRIRTAAAAAVPVTALGIAVAGMAIFGGGMSRNELAPAATASESGDIVLTDGSETAVQQEAGSETAVQQETENSVDLEDMTLISSDSAGGYTAEMYFSGITHAPTEEENYYKTDDVVIKLTDPEGRTLISSINTADNVKKNITDNYWTAGFGVPVLGGPKLFPVSYNGEQHYILRVSTYYDQGSDQAGIENMSGDESDDLLFAPDYVPSDIYTFFSCGDKCFEDGVLYPYRDYNTGLQYVYSCPADSSFEAIGDNRYSDGEMFYGIDPVNMTIKFGPMETLLTNGSCFGYDLSFNVQFVNNLPSFNQQGTPSPDGYYSFEDGTITVTSPDGRTAQVKLSECGDAIKDHFTTIFADAQNAFYYCLKLLKLNGKEEYVLMLRNSTALCSSEEYVTTFFALNESSFETGRIEPYVITKGGDSFSICTTTDGSTLIEGSDTLYEPSNDFTLTFDPETLAAQHNSPVFSDYSDPANDHVYDEQHDSSAVFNDKTATSDIDKIYEALSDDEVVRFDTELDTEIYALADGVVELAGYSYMDGIYAYIRAEDGKYIGYLHCNEILVREGDKVTKGQMIGYAGCTGKAETYEAAYTLKASVQSVIDRTIDSELYSARDIYGKRYIQFNF